MDQLMDQKWYKHWFNTPYYHILYKNRSKTEAVDFIDNLFEHIQPKKNATLLDIACGRGRHAKHMSEKGFNTTGIDLSESSIAYAKKYESDNLHFHVQDMRQRYCSNCFDYAFNLFTSFGYFDTQEEHLKALRVFNEALKPGGIFVIDYFNAFQIVNNLIPFEIKKEDDITFRITKEAKNKKIYKTIAFEDQAQEYNFVEEVFAFTEKDFNNMLEMSNFTVVEKFGDYLLEPFDQYDSPRLILICQKKYA